ncbi:MAG: alpha/beta hydrolase [Gaiellaceae bacterium]|jgi:pimeloyl-ACP methyl ester carboxylesterase
MNAPLKGKLARTRWLAGALILAVALALAGQVLAGSAAKGRLVKVGGHRLYLVCAGKGHPVVMLEAGLGDWSRGWKAVLARSAKVGTTVCAYDRFGLGRSGTYTGTRTIASVVSDLHTLVRKAKLRGPYVFAGASIGGIVTRSYAHLYPKQVAGVVFFDSVPDDWDQYVGISVFDGGGEKLDIAAATARLRASDKLGKRPLVVLEAGDESYLEQVTQRSDLRDYWDPSQRKLAHISTNSLFAVATGKPHWIQSAAPKLSAEAIRLVVASVRSKKPLPECAKSKLPKLGAAC